MSFVLETIRIHAQQTQNTQHTQTHSCHCRREYTNGIQTCGRAFSPIESGVPRHRPWKSCIYPLVLLAHTPSAIVYDFHTSMVSLCSRHRYRHYNMTDENFTHSLRTHSNLQSFFIRGAHLTTEWRPGRTGFCVDSRPSRANASTVIAATADVTAATITCRLIESKQTNNTFLPKTSKYISLLFIFKYNREVIANHAIHVTILFFVIWNLRGCLSYRCPSWVPVTNENICCKQQTPNWHSTNWSMN